MGLRQGSNVHFEPFLFVQAKHFSIVYADYSAVLIQLNEMKQRSPALYVLNVIGHL